jgi:hypothetical protein
MKEGETALQKIKKGCCVEDVLCDAKTEKRFVPCPNYVEEDEKKPFALTRWTINFARFSLFLSLTAEKEGRQTNEFAE